MKKNSKLQATREKAGYTQKRLAEETDLSTVAYQRYEYNKREPGIRTAIRIADALGVQDYQEFKELFTPE